jgi:hypothetical protein
LDDHIQNVDEVEFDDDRLMPDYSGDGAGNQYLELPLGGQNDASFDDSSSGGYDR